jgi:hypothetical protein
MRWCEDHAIIAGTIIGTAAGLAAYAIYRGGVFLLFGL